MEVEGSLGVGSRLVVNKCALTPEERENYGKDDAVPEQEDNDVEPGDPLTSMRYVSFPFTRMKYWPMKIQIG